MINLKASLRLAYIKVYACNCTRTTPKNTIQRMCTSPYKYCRTQFFHSPIDFCAHSPNVHVHTCTHTYQQGNSKHWTLSGPKAATSIFKHFLLQNLWNSTISHRIRNLIICYLVWKKIYHLINSRIVYHRTFVSSYGNTCDVRENMLVLETPSNTVR